MQEGVPEVQMAEVYPFIGTRYNSQLIGNLGKVVCPPGDDISPELQNELYDRHEHNAVRLQKCRDDDSDESEFSNRYTRAANTLGTWRSDGVVIEDEKPSFYLLEQVFTGPGGEEQRRAGFVAKVKLDEDTPIGGEAVDDLTGGKLDCLEMIRNTNANLGGVTAIFSDPDESVLDILRSRMKEKPWEELTDDKGTVHRLWVLQKKDLVLALVDNLKTRNLFIAEGYSRYLAAQIYRDENREAAGKADGKQPSDHIMMTLFPAQQESVQFTPMHRGLTRSIMADVDLKDALVELSDFFDIAKDKVDLSKPEAEADRLQKMLSEYEESRPAVALVHASGAAYLLALQEDMTIENLYDGLEMPDCVGRLDACILHNYIINQVFVGNPEYELEDDECIYTPSTVGLLELLKSKKIVCGFILNPLSVSRMLEVAESQSVVQWDLGALVPQICTGLVMRNLQTDVRRAARK